MWLLVPDGSKHTLVELSLEHLVMRWIALLQSFGVMMMLLLDVINCHKRNAFREVVHFLIGGLCKEGYWIVEPSEIVPVNHRPAVHQVWKYKNNKGANTDNKGQNVAFGSHSF